MTLELKRYKDSAMSEKTCATCIMWERDIESKAGGWCPIPNPKDPFKRPYKYVCQSHKACKHYKPEERKE